MRSASELIIRDLGGIPALTKFSEDDVQGIRPDKVDEIADQLMLIVADVVATLINAGSERDAVLENETLREALHAELNGWAIR